MISYFLGNDPAQWHPRVPVYTGIVYPEIYPGIDLHYDDTGRLIKGTYVVSPQRDPNVIGWHYEGAQAISVDTKTSDLTIALPDGKTTLAELAPIAWQERNGEQVAVAVAYTVDAASTVHFAIAPGSYDPALLLVIDPTIVFSGYTYGEDGSNYDENNSVAVDAQGNTYVASESYVSGNGVGSSAVLTKYNASGARTLTIISGGTGDDSAQAVAVDGQGNIYFAGYTLSADFTVSPNPTGNVYRSR